MTAYTDQKTGLTTLRDDDIRVIVADPEWQAIRGAFVGTWKVRPGLNVETLRRYLYAVSPVEYLRFRRVYNYLTGSAFRIGVIQHPDIDVLLAELRAMKDEVYARHDA